MARRKIRKMFVVEEKFVEDEEEVVTGRVGRNRNRTWRSHSRRLLVLTWHLLSFCLSLSAPPPLSPLSFSFSLMSGMLRPRHALIGDGLRRPTTAAYARTQLGKCGGGVVGRARVRLSGAMPRRRAPTGNSYSRCPATDFDYPPLLMGGYYLYPPFF